MAEDRKFARETDSPYVAQISMGPSFQTHREILEHMFDDELIKDQEPGAVEGIVAALPKHQLTRKRRDTALGGNDAVNCYYQFCENDDLVHPTNRVGNEPNQGLGRVYNEVFDEQQQLLYLSFGVPDFANAASFMGKAYDRDLSSLMNTGDVSLVERVGGFLGNVIGTVLTFPFLPLKWTSQLIAGEFGGPARYFDFKPTMALYYKMTNVIIAHLAVNMDLAIVGEADESETVGAPRILARHGMDILTILSRKWKYDKGGDEETLNTDEVMDELHNNPGFEKEGWVEGFKQGTTEAMKFVGWRIEKGVDSSESLSNSTKETELAQMINSAVSGGRQRTFSMAALKETSPGQMLDTVYKGVESVVSNTLESFNLQGGLEVLKGVGFLDIPEVWESSSFTKSYSFDFQLRTPQPDKVSIMYSLYIPLAMLLAGAFPRSVGQNAYTSPFLVRAYCQGMFAIPLGIVDSITIKRGAAEFGWSRDLLPTQIDVSFSIKDLSPVMHIALASGGYKDWMSILGQNSTFQEYMLTLGGTNIAERSLRLRQIKKRTQILMQISSNNKFNSYMQGFSLSNTRLGRVATRMWPSTRLPSIED